MSIRPKTLLIGLIGGMMSFRVAANGFGLLRFLEVHKLNNKKMNALKFIIRKKEDYRSERIDLKNDYKVANKLGFSTETNRIERDISKTSEIIELLEEIAIEVQKEKVFTETEISHLQSEVHKITGDGEVMQLFNKLLGVNTGGGS